MHKRAAAQRTEYSAGVCFACGHQWRNPEPRLALTGDTAERQSLEPVSLFGDPWHGYSGHMHVMNADELTFSSPVKLFTPLGITDVTTWTDVFDYLLEHLVNQGHSKAAIMSVLSVPCALVFPEGGKGYVLRKTAGLYVQNQQTSKLWGQIARLSRVSGLPVTVSFKWQARAPLPYRNRQGFVTTVTPGAAHLGLSG